MYLLDAEDATIPAFKSAWASLGDSIVVVGGDGLWNCHVHTDDIGGAVEAGIEAGRPRNIRVTDLLEQVEEEGWVAEAAALAPIVHAPEDMVETAVVAIAVGDGVRRLLASLGRAGDRGRGPVDEPLDRADPRGGGAVPVRLGHRAAEQQEHRRRRPPGRRAHEQVGGRRPHPLGGGGARRAARLRPRRRARANTTELAYSVARVTAGEVTQSVRDTVAECGPIRKGDWIAIGPEGICVATDSAGRGRVRARRRARRRRQRDRHGPRGRRRPRRGDPAACASTSRSPTRAWSSRSTTAASRSTRT